MVQHECAAHHFMDCIWISVDFIRVIDVDDDAFLRQYVAQSLYGLLGYLDLELSSEALC